MVLYFKDEAPLFYIINNEYGLFFIFSELKI